MPDSKPYSLAKQFQAWAQAITVANGYNTDAGQRVYLGRRFVDAEFDTFPLIVVLYAGELLNSVGDEHQGLLSVTVTGYTEIVDDSDQNLRADLLFQDIRRAIKTDEFVAQVESVRPTEYEIIQPDPDSRIITVSMLYAANYFEIYGE